MASIVAFDFQGGPLNGTSLWTNSRAPEEAREANRLFHVSGRGTVGWRFRVPSPTSASHELYQCVATGELADVLVIQCQHCES